MPYVTVGKEYSGNIQLYYKDWGTGQPVVFSHGWPLSADSWEAQMLFLASKGYRCIAHDRRGRGRSSQPWDGNEMDTYADDLATLIETLDLKDAVLVGFSTGGGEVARYVGRHGTTRVAKVGLISAVPPLMLKTKANPGGLPIEVFDGRTHRLGPRQRDLFEEPGWEALCDHDRHHLSDRLRDLPAWRFWEAACAGHHHAGCAGRRGGGGSIQGVWPCISLRRDH